MRLEYYRLRKLHMTMLMWSYYANGHKGVALRVDIEESNDYDIEPIIYKEEGSIITDDLDAKVAVKRLLTTKYAIWTHEEEVRVLTQSEFVKVEIIELMFRQIRRKLLQK